MQNLKIENLKSKATSDFRSKPRAKRKQPGPIKPGQHLLLKPQVLELLGGVSYSTLWGWMNEGQFPHPLALGPPNGRTTKIAWISSEVHDWIASRPRRKIGGLKQHRAEQERNRRKPERAAR
jgi:predicted DNA-binding transcriptional regulator AlpA